ncbi:MAG: hypothetical protein AABZ33_00185 [Chloroflexota bacterium]
MGETIQDIRAALLSILESILVPDWGAVVALIPLVLLGAIILGLGSIARRWLEYYLTQPVPPRPVSREPADLHTELRRRVALIPVGAILVVLAISVLPTRIRGIPQVGPDMLVLVAGIVVALVGTGHAVRAAESADRHDTDSGYSSASRSLRPSLRRSLRRLAAERDRIPRPVQPLAGVVAGAAIVAGAFVLAGGSPARGALPEVAVAPLLVGILIALGSVVAAVRAWERDGQRSGANL